MTPLFRTHYTLGACTTDDILQMAESAQQIRGTVSRKHKTLNLRHNVATFQNSTPTCKTWWLFYAKRTLHNVLQRCVELFEIRRQHAKHDAMFNAFCDTVSQTPVGALSHLQHIIICASPPRSSLRNSKNCVIIIIFRESLAFETK